MSSSFPMPIKAPSRKPNAEERTYSEDRMLDYVGWTLVLLATAAGMATGLCIWGPLGMLPLSLLPMLFTWGVFDIFEPALRGHLAECRVRNLLRRYDVPAVHDIYLATADGRRTQLDHVAFLGRTVAVIETKSITGVVERQAGVWSRLVYGRERRFTGRTPQQQALEARDVLLAAYPAWGRGALAVTVLTHGSLGESFEGESWVVTADQLGTALGRFRQVPDEQALRRWTDLSRFLSANKRTRSDKMRFWRSHLLNPKTFNRHQLVAFGMAAGSGMPLVLGGTYYLVVWFLIRVVTPWLAAH